MSKKLEEFIEENRQSLDATEPSGDLWNRVESGIQKPATKTGKFSALHALILIIPLAAVLFYVTLKSGVVTKPVAVTKNTGKTQGPQPSVQINNDNKPENTIQKNSSVITKKNSAADTALTPQLLTPPPQNNAPAAVSNSFQAAAALPVTGTAYRKINGSGTWFGKGDTINIDTVFAGIKVLRINSYCFDVNVETQPGNDLNFKTSIVPSKSKGIVIGKNKQTIHYKKQDSTLYITVESISKAKLVMGSLTPAKIVLDFKVPAATAVIVNSDYGDVAVKGLHTNACNITANSGNITLTSILADLTLVAMYGDVRMTKITGNLNAELNSGDLHITDLSGTIYVKSSYGDQDLKNISGHVSASCKSGNVKISNMVGNAGIVAGYGNVVLHDVKGGITAEANSGDVIGKNVQLTGNMKITAQYGDIKMDLLNDLKELSFDLGTSYGKLTIDKNGEKLSDEKKLVVTRGSIQVKCFTNSGDQYYR